MSSGAEVAAEALWRWGYTTVFAYPGTSELALCAAIAARNGLRVVNSRGDQEAVFMAAGGGLAGHRCAAVLHGARGLTSALGAVADARRSEIPLVCLVGMPSHASARYLPPHGEPRLIDAAAAFAKAGIDCSAASGKLVPADFAASVNEALRLATDHPGGPVLLGLPEDVLAKRFVPAGLLRMTGISCRSQATPDISGALALIEAASRPVIMIDDYFLRSAGADQDLRRFSAALGAPVLQLAYRRGPMLFQQVRPEHVAAFAGRYDPADARHRGMLAAADLLITIEDRNMYPRVAGYLPSCAKLAFTSNASATRKNGYLRDSDVLVAGDVSGSLTRIAARIERQGRYREGRRPAPDAPLPAPEPELMPGRQPARCVPAAAEVVRAVGHGLRAITRPVIIDDSQMFGGLVAENYLYLPPDSRVHGSHGGFVGGGLATAVGLAIADPGAAVLATAGDQGFTNGIKALAAASEHEIPFVALVINNGASVSLAKQAEYDGVGGAAGPLLRNAPRMSYLAIAKGFGLAAIRCEWPDEVRRTAAVLAASRRLSASIRRGYAARRPYLIELVLPARPDFWAGVWQVRGSDELAADLHDGDLPCVPST